MPYLVQDPNEDQNQGGSSSSGAASSSAIGGGATATEQPSTSAGAGYVGGGGQAGTSSLGNASPAATSPGGGYTNLINYLSANEGGGSTTGQAGANVVTQGATDAQAKQQAYGTSAGGQIDEGAKGAQLDQGVLGTIQGSAKSVDPNLLATIKNQSQNYTGKANYAAPDLSYNAPNVPTASYGGPADIGHVTGQAAADQTAALGANQNVKTLAGLAQGDQTQVAGLLRQAYTQPNYSSGENGLDAFLASGSQGGKQALGATKGVNEGVQKSYSDLNDALSGKIKGAQDTAASTNKTYQDALAKAKAQSEQTAQTYRDAEAQGQSQIDANANSLKNLNNRFGGPLVVANNTPEASPVGGGGGGGFLPNNIVNSAVKAIGDAATSPGSPTIDNLQKPVYDAFAPVAQGVGHALHLAGGGKVPYDELFKRLGGVK